jgi:hypothetical protein
MKVRLAKSATKGSLRSAARTRKKGRTIADPMLQIIARIAQQGKTRDEWDTSITHHLAIMWLEMVPPADLKIPAAHVPSWLPRMSPEALRVLDDIIVRQAVTLGWRIGHSGLVQWRLSEWERVPDGLKLLRRYHLAVERAARIFQRREKPPLDDPGLYRFKVETVKELRLLLNKMRNAYQDRFCEPPDDLEPILLAHFLKAVKGRSKSLPFLAANCARWRGFFEERPTELRLHLTGVRLCPASLFDSWLSWCKGVDNEWLRQTISRLGSSIRKPIRNSKL